MLGAIAAKRATLAGDKLNKMDTDLPDALGKAVEARLETARAEAWARRLWQGDADRLDGRGRRQVARLALRRSRQAGRFRRAQAAHGGEARRFKHAVLLGMGGSSLGPEVLSEMIGQSDGSPLVLALDSTDPGQIATTLDQIEPADTLFLVSSKSGTTMEPELLRAFFWDKSGGDGSHFVAVTDPGSKLEASAKADGFAHIFPGDPAIGGRYSVLSNFGMVPAAIMGIDVEAFFATTQPMTQACGPDAPPGANPGFQLGAILGEAANAGRDKVTIMTSPALRPFGAWLEQLLAESTGKQGKGLVPVDLEPLLPVESYGQDRVFAVLTLAGDVDAELAATVDGLAAAGQPVVRIGLAHKDQIGQEFFRWEIATAVAGAVIGIDPFDQPDVEDAKIKTRALVDAYEKTGQLDAEQPFAQSGTMAFYSAGDTRFDATDPLAILRAHLSSATAGDYVGFLAYVERDEQHEAAIADMREAVAEARGVATVAGFGPRFLHSTGQAYKGGPRSGVFVEITRDAKPDLAIPGHKASFGTVQLAQARGDLAVLGQRGQRALRVHLKDGDVAALTTLIQRAMQS